ncbi:hypothetical protein JOB18_048318 [Solea senegalensis]|uniref:Uncharacterized protein n=1 Tax=Solea senegalensis TaxID=28829 RepID=A0AAV6PXU5_SOLSE|nr:hypothetical protein JOB18_048318 [Solea senegalensis]
MTEALAKVQLVQKYITQHGNLLLDCVSSCRGYVDVIPTRQFAASHWSQTVRQLVANATGSTCRGKWTVKNLKKS